MKKLIVTLFIAAIAVVNTNAQERKQPPPKKTPQERADDMTAHMTKALDLNADQQQKVKALILKRESEREAAMSKAKENREQVQKEMNAEMQKILTPDQYDKFLKKREEMKQKREQKRMHPDPNPNGPGGNPPPPPPAEPK